ncbi:toll/interleukin-1 receptor domain-containing protein [Pararhodospirillum photometricum]|uniref:toll/interleukin-1 receptor domain-containing protein n=1 Tax=Pararhodospirillum photometricum TaxID=1084 RepID=UPI0012FF4697|nr:toll/interleukin-1 receptor domain-containing protein [Pararhodospirillum photometricum]
MPWQKIGGKDGIPNIFISYSSEDLKYVEEILNTLRDRVNIKLPSTFWMDKWKIRHGSVIVQEVSKGVNEADLVVLFASQNSLKSGWVKNEWMKKYKEEIETDSVKVITAIIDDLNQSNLPSELTGKLAITMSEYEKSASIDQLAESICYHLSNSLEMDAKKNRENK